MWKISWDYSINVFNVKLASGQMCVIMMLVCSHDHDVSLFTGPLSVD